MEPRHRSEATVAAMPPTVVMESVAPEKHPEQKSPAAVLLDRISRSLSVYHSLQFGGAVGADRGAVFWSFVDEMRRTRAAQLSALAGAVLVRREAAATSEQRQHHAASFSSNPAELAGDDQPMTQREGNGPSHSSSSSNTSFSVANAAPPPTHVTTRAPPPPPSHDGGPFKTLFGFDELPYDDMRACFLEAATFHVRDEQHGGRIPRAVSELFHDRWSLGRTSSFLVERCVLDMNRLHEAVARRRRGPHSVSIITHAQASTTNMQREALLLDCGCFAHPSVEELRLTVRRQLVTAAAAVGQYWRAGFGDSAGISVKNIIGDVSDFHLRHPRGVFQAASQFNSLEFASPSSTPELGVAVYEHDKTQGPACAVACYAGTVYRNYLVPFPATGGAGGGAVVVTCVDNVQRGQTADRQLNGLADVQQYLAMEAQAGQFHQDRFLRVINGYTDSTDSALQALNDLSRTGRVHDQMISLIRVGVQEATHVTAAPPLRSAPRPVVTQVYCSALSIAYAPQVHDRDLWRNCALAVLTAAYEATLLVGVLEALRRVGVQQQNVEPLRVPVFLTKVGGGAFGNDAQWIVTAILEAMNRIKFLVRQSLNGVGGPGGSALPPLDLYVVHFRGIEKGYENLCQQQTQ